MGTRAQGFGVKGSGSLAVDFEATCSLHSAAPISCQRNGGCEQTNGVIQVKNLRFGVFAEVGNAQGGREQGAFSL